MTFLRPPTTPPPAGAGGDGANAHHGPSGPASQGTSSSAAGAASGRGGTTAAGAASGARLLAECVAVQREAWRPVPTAVPTALGATVGVLGKCRDRLWKVYLGGTCGSRLACIHVLLFAAHTAHCMDSAMGLISIS